MSETKSQHVVSDQSAVAAILRDPQTFGLSPDTSIEQVTTHASMVFLTPDRAIKVKRAVGFPYMDFSTVEKRRAACAAELRLNRRTAPQIYRGARPIVRVDGQLKLGELQSEIADAGQVQGEVVDWAVEMARFDQSQLLDRLAERQSLTPETVDALADEVADFHEAAEVVSGGGADALGWVIDENAEEFPETPELFDRSAADALTRVSRAALASARTLLDRRAADGLVRRCHGDLHLRNVVLLDGQPTLFDAIEFNDAIACIDVLYDLAFLLMDLDRRGLAPEANRLLNRYLGVRDDIEGLAALPLFLSLRAAIRAKVSASALAAQPDSDARERVAADARDFFAAAQAYLETHPPRLFAVGGVSGSGKTTVARELAPHLGDPPGALIVRSDVERKRLFGVRETEPLPERAYQGKINAEVYQAMLCRARRGLEAGRTVIVEATFLDRSSRAEARKLAETVGVPFQGLWLQAAEDTLKSRVAARTGDASDATVEVVEGQLRRAPKGEIAWPAVDAQGAPEQVAQRALKAIEAPSKDD